MARRPTLQDVAREAGLSIATVNRVVAAAPGVREETARKVAEAAAKVGYHGRNVIAQNVLKTLPAVRLGFLLHNEKQSFYINFAETIRSAVARVTDARVSIKIAFPDSQAPGDLANALARMKEQVDVVAATAVNHPTVTAAVADLAEAGVPCVALLSDFAQGVRAAYFGTNNLKVGRGAAHALSVAARGPGKIALFVGGNRWHGHELRETGFRSQFREAAREFTVLDTLVNLDTRRLTYEVMLDLLERNPDLVGVYPAGGGMEGALVALREARDPGEVAMVANEITPESRRAMDEGYVTLIVGTPLERLCSLLVADMVRMAVTKGPGAGQVFLDPMLVMPEFF